jgi:predicted RNA-binding Zn-ribbon protein involved in translation (DUF1610 family)
MICEKCKAESPGHLKFCPKCGVKRLAPVEERVSPTKVCPKCGTSNLIGAKFCKVDGYRFESSAAEATVEPQIVTPEVADVTASPMRPAFEPTPIATSDAEVPTSVEESVADVAAAQTKVCPKCGTSNLIGAKFCKVDGYRFESSAAEATVEPQIVTPEVADVTASPMRPAFEPTPIATSDAEVPTSVEESVADVAAAQTKVCPKCGTSNLIGAKFCKVDGYRFESSAAEATVEPQIVTPEVADVTASPMRPAFEPTPIATSDAEVPTSVEEGVADVAAAQTKVCPKCGTSNLIGAKFCKVDGYRFESSAAEATVEPQIVTPEVADVTASPMRPAFEPTPIATSDAEVPTSVEEGVADVAAAQTKVCPKCGTSNLIGAKFCKVDGYRFESSAAEATVEPQIVTPEVADVTASPMRPAFEPTPIATSDAEVPTSVEESVAAAASKLPLSSTAHSEEGQAGTNVICPKCGTPNLSTARFCKKDGAVLSHGGPVPSVAAVSHVEPRTEQVVGAASLRRTGWNKKATLIGGLVVALVGVFGGGAYLYWAGHIGDLQGVQTASAPPSTLNASGLNTHLHSAGLTTVFTRVGTSGEVTLEGTVASRTDKDRAIQLALAYPGVESVEDTLGVMEAAPSVPDLAPAQLAVPSPVTALSPAAPAPPPAQLAVSKPAPALSPPAGQLDPAKLEGEINRALRKGGASGVTAQVADDLTVILKGATTSNAQKDLAFQITRRFQGVSTVRDKVFVVQ